MAVTTVPERIEWAVGLLGLRSTHQVLEIGCGRGVAAELVCNEIRRGRYVGIDRSAKAITAAIDRNSVHTESGRAQFRTEALEALDSDGLGKFDRVFAVNVNHFWVSPAEPELALVARLLRPAGRLVLAYDPPSPAGIAKLADRLVANLERAGYRTSTETGTASSSALFAVLAQPPA